GGSVGGGSVDGGAVDGGTVVGGSVGGGAVAGGTVAGGTVDGGSVDGGSVGGGTVGGTVTGGAVGGGDVGGGASAIFTGSAVLVAFGGTIAAGSPVRGGPSGAPPLAGATRARRPIGRSSGPNASRPPSALGSVSSTVYDWSGGSGAGAMVARNTTSAATAACSSTETPTPTVKSRSHSGASPRGRVRAMVQCRSGGGSVTNPTRTRPASRAGPRPAPRCHSANALAVGPRLSGATIDRPLATSRSDRSQLLGELRQRVRGVVQVDLSGLRDVDDELVVGAAERRSSHLR